MSDEKLIARVRQAAVERFVMEPNGIHGPKHWERVRLNAEELVRENGAGDLLVCQLFAYLHDCCREDDGDDPEHGLRASDFIATLKDGLLTLETERIELLRYACEHHDKGRIPRIPL